MDTRKDMDSENILYFTAQSCFGGANLQMDVKLFGLVVSSRGVYRGSRKSTSCLS